MADLSDTDMWGYPRNVRTPYPNALTAVQLQMREDQLRAKQQAGRNEFMKGLNLGKAGVTSGVQGTVASLQDAFGYNAEAAARYEAAGTAAAHVAQANQLAVPEFTGIESVGQVPKWIAGAAGQAVPSIAMGVAGGLAARAGLGGAARLAATRAPNLATALANPTVNTHVGAGLGMLPQEMGESAMNLYSDPVAMANTTAGGRLAINLGKGVVTTALESFVPAHTIARLIKPGKVAAGVRGALAHTAKVAGEGAAGEFLTEGTQNIVGDVAHGIANPAHQINPKAAFNAAMAGAVAGGGMGAVGGAGGVAKARLFGEPAEVAPPKTIPDRAVDAVNAGVAATARAVSKAGGLVENWLDRTEYDKMTSSADFNTLTERSDPASPDHEVAKAVSADAFSKGILQRWQGLGKTDQGSDLFDAAMVYQQAQQSGQGIGQAARDFGEKLRVIHNLDKQTKKYNDMADAAPGTGAKENAVGTVDGPDNTLFKQWRDSVNDKLPLYSGRVGNLRAATTHTEARDRALTALWQYAKHGFSLTKDGPVEWPSQFEDAIGKHAPALIRSAAKLQHDQGLLDSAPAANTLKYSNGKALADQLEQQTKFTDDTYKSLDAMRKPLPDAGDERVTTKKVVNDLKGASEDDIVKAAQRYFGGNFAEAAHIISQYKKQHLGGKLVARDDSADKGPDENGAEGVETTLAEQRAKKAAEKASATEPDVKPVFFGHGERKGKNVEVPFGDGLLGQAYDSQHLTQQEMLHGKIDDSTGEITKGVFEGHDPARQPTLVGVVDALHTTYTKSGTVDGQSSNAARQTKAAEATAIREAEDKLIHKYGTGKEKLIIAQGDQHARRASLDRINKRYQVIQTFVNNTKADAPERTHTAAEIEALQIDPNTYAGRGTSEHGVVYFERTHKLDATRVNKTPWATLVGKLLAESAKLPQGNVTSAEDARALLDSLNAAIGALAASEGFTGKVGFREKVGEDVKWVEGDSLPDSLRLTANVTVGDLKAELKAKAEKEVSGVPWTETFNIAEFAAQEPAEMKRDRDTLAKALDKDDYGSYDPAYDELANDVADLQAAAEALPKNTESKKAWGEYFKAKRKLDNMLKAAKKNLVLMNEVIFEDTTNATEDNPNNRVIRGQLSTPLNTELNPPPGQVRVVDFTFGPDMEIQPRGDSKTFNPQTLAMLRTVAEKGVPALNKAVAAAVAKTSVPNVRLALVQAKRDVDAKANLAEATKRDAIAQRDLDAAIKGKTSKQNVDMKRKVSEAAKNKLAVAEKRLDDMPKIAKVIDATLKRLDEVHATQASSPTIKAVTARMKGYKAQALAAIPRSDEARTAWNLFKKAKDALTRLEEQVDLEGAYEPYTTTDAQKSVAERRNKLLMDGIRDAVAAGKSFADAARDVATAINEKVDVYRQEVLDFAEVKGSITKEDAAKIAAKVDATFVPSKDSKPTKRKTPRWEWGDMTEADREAFNQMDTQPTLTPAEKLAIAAYLNGVTLDTRSDQTASKPEAMRMFQRVIEVGNQHLFSLDKRLAVLNEGIRQRNAKMSATDGGVQVPKATVEDVERMQQEVAVLKAQDELDDARDNLRMVIGKDGTGKPTETDMMAVVSAERRLAELKGEKTATAPTMDKMSDEEIASYAQDLARSDEELDFEDFTDFGDPHKTYETVRGENDIPTRENTMEPDAPPTATMNIWHGTGENKGLSNLAHRPFEYGNRPYRSVEHAYQSLKSGPGKFNTATYNNPAAKPLNNRDTLTKDGWNLQLMRQLILRSFQQNVEAAARLLATGDATFTHTQDRGIWKTEFPKALTDVRNYLRKNPGYGVKLPETGNPHLAKDQAKSLQATQFIGKGSERSSTVKYMRAWGNLANTGNYTADSRVFVSVEGTRVGRIPLDKVEVNKALAAGATIIADKAASRSTPHNVGERELAAHLKENGYKEVEPGIWKPESVATRVVERAARVNRADVRGNPDTLYVFGDNDARSGLGGQAAAMRGEPNAVGVRTKATPTRNASAYWSDTTYAENVKKIDADFARIEAHKGRVVIPAAGLGTGLSELATRAPKTLAYIESKIAALEQKARSDVTPAATATPLTTEEAKEIADAHVKSFKEHVNLALAQSGIVSEKSGKGISGTFSEKDNEMLIRISLFAKDKLGVLRHEHMHALFAFLRKNGSNETQAILTRLAKNKIVMGQLRTWLAEEKGAYDALTNDEEAVAYLYQLWNKRDDNGKPLIHLGPQTETFFQKVAAFLKNLFGMTEQYVKDAAQVEKIFQALKDGDFADNPDAVVQALEKRLSESKLAKAQGEKIISSVLNNTFLKEYIYSTLQVLKDTGNSELIALSKKFYVAEGTRLEKGAKQGSLDATKQEINRRLNTLTDMFAALEKALGKESVEAARKLLVAKTPDSKIHDPALKTFVRDYRLHLDAMHKYAKDAGVKRLDPETHEWVDLGKIADYYFHVNWDADAVLSNIEGFREIMKKEHMVALEKLVKEAEIERTANAHLSTVSASNKPADQQITVDDIINAIVQNITSTSGAPEVGESSSRLGITPYAAAVNRRTLTFIKDYAPFDEFMNKDFAQMATNYAVQMVKRAESVRAFGNGAVDVQRSMDRAYVEALLGPGMADEVDAMMEKETGDIISKYGYSETMDRHHAAIMAHLLQMDTKELKADHTARDVRRVKVEARLERLQQEVREAFDSGPLEEDIQNLDHQLDLMSAEQMEIERELARRETEGDTSRPTRSTVNSIAEGMVKGTEEEKAAKIKAAREFMATPIKAVMALEGTLGREISDTTRKVFQYVTAFQNVNKLVFTLFTSFVDPLGIIVRGGTVGDAFSAFTRGLRMVKENWLKEHSEDALEDLMRQIGVVEAHSYLSTLGETYSSQYAGGAKLHRFNTKFFNLIGMESWNRAMRITAGGVAMNFIKLHLTSPNRHSPRYMEELGLDPTTPDAYLKDGQLDTNNRDVQQAIMKWVDGAVLNPNASHRAIKASDPHMMLVYHLKQFTYSFHNVILRRVATEMENGNYTPLMALASYIPLIVAADAMRAMLSPGDEPAWMKGGIGSLLSHGIARSPIGGIPQLIVDGLPFVGAGHPVSSLGPAAGQTSDLITALFNPYQTVTNEVLGLLPGGTVLRKLAPPPPDPDRTGGLGLGAEAGTAQQIGKTLLKRGL